MFRIELPSPAEGLRFTVHCSSFFWNKSTELVPRTSLRIFSSQGDWSLPCVTRTSRVLTLLAILRVLTDIDHSARSLALLFLGHRRRVLIHQCLANTTQALRTCLPCTPFTILQQLTALFLGRNVHSLPPTGVVETRVQRT